MWHFSAGQPAHHCHLYWQSLLQAIDIYMLANAYSPCDDMLFNQVTEPLQGHFFKVQSVNKAVTISLFHLSTGDYSTVHHEQK